jgi:hypothetical protein
MTHTATLGGAHADRRGLADRIPFRGTPAARRRLMPAQPRRPGLAWHHATLACAIAGFGVASCSLKDGTSLGAIMAITPAQLADSASVGDTASRLLGLNVANLGGGELRWQVHLATPAAWLTVHPDSGIAPSVIQIRALPAGLAVGEYRDTVFVISNSASGTAVIPLDFRIVP